MTASIRIQCNSCGDWTDGPYRRGRCPRCMGVWVGGIKVCCGDCDVFPCECPRVDDADAAWLGAREGGAPVSEVVDLPAADHSYAAAVAA